jgi:N-acetylglucosaminyldiphosphoundecaprenol N-acetyl-beta-D-mannosaminyltransferase
MPAAPTDRPADRGSVTAVSETGSQPPSPTESASPLSRRRLFGLDFIDDTDLHRVLGDVLAPAHVDDGLLPAVVTPNVDYLVRRAHAPDAANALEQARWCLPDGQPIVWASRLVGRPLAARLAGSSLVESFWSNPSLASVPVAVIASSQSIADAVTQSRPSARVVVAPQLTDQSLHGVATFVEQHLDEFVAARPALVFVGIGFPKDVLTIPALLSAWPRDVDRPVVLAVGASFELLFGLRKRAPQWMQRYGLEWLFRFAQEPRRLFVRYFIRDPAFLLLVAREWRRREPRRRVR